MSNIQESDNYRFEGFFRTILFFSRRFLILSDIFIVEFMICCGILTIKNKNMIIVDKNEFKQKMTLDVNISIIYQSRLLYYIMERRKLYYKNSRG